MVVVQWQRRIDARLSGVHACAKIVVLVFDLIVFSSFVFGQRKWCVVW